MITWENVEWYSRYGAISRELAALDLYVRDLCAMDEIWCGCGDEIILDAPWSDRPYVDQQGQYCCWICAETHYAAINGLPDMWANANTVAEGC